MPYFCYAYTGGTLSMRTVPADYVPQAGEFLSSPDPATESALQAQFPGYSGVVSKLNAYADSKLAFSNQGEIEVNVATSGPAVIAHVDVSDGGRADVAGLTLQVQQGATSVHWYQSEGDLILPDTQFMVLANALAAYRAAAVAAWSAAYAGAKDGSITTPAQIDALPWPSRGP